MAAGAAARCGSAPSFFLAGHRPGPLNSLLAPLGTLALAGVPGPAQLIGGSRPPRAVEALPCLLLRFCLTGSRPCRFFHSVLSVPFLPGLPTAGLGGSGDASSCSDTRPFGLNSKCERRPGVPGVPGRPSRLELSGPREQLGVLVRGHLRQTLGGAVGRRAGPLTAPVWRAWPRGSLPLWGRFGRVGRWQPLPALPGTE